MDALETLERLRFVSGIESENGSTGEVRLRTSDGTFALAAVRVPSPAGLTTIDRAMNWMSERGKEKTILLSARLSRPAIRRLVAGGYNFADGTGKCQVALSDRFVATIVDFDVDREPEEGIAIGESVVTVLKNAPGTPRGPGHQVLFVLLARAELLACSIRQIASSASVSRKAVTHMLDYSTSHGWIEGRRSSRQWSRDGWAAALDMWVRGYADSVRRRMHPRIFKTPHDDLSTLKDHLVSALAGGPVWRWHGETAAHELVRHYAGNHVSLVVDGDIRPFLETVPALRARQGNLVVMDSFSPLCLEGETPTTAHPILVYAELANSSDPRSQETARLLLAEGLLK